MAISSSSVLLCFLTDTPTFVCTCRPIFLASVETRRFSVQTVRAHERKQQWHPTQPVNRNSGTRKMSVSSFFKFACSTRPALNQLVQLIKPNVHNPIHSIRKEANHDIRLQVFFLKKFTINTAAPPPTLPKTFSLGTRHPSNTNSHVLEPRMPSLSSFCAVENPGKPFSTIKAVTPYKWRLTCATLLSMEVKTVYFGSSIKISFCIDNQCIGIRTIGNPHFVAYLQPRKQLSKVLEKKMFKPVRT